MIKVIAQMLRVVFRRTSTVTLWGCGIVLYLGAGFSFLTLLLLNPMLVGAVFAPPILIRFIYMWYHATKESL